MTDAALSDDRLAQLRDFARCGLLSHEAMELLGELDRLRASSAGVRSAAVAECARLLEGWKPGNFTKSEIVEKMRALAPGGGGVWVPVEPTDAMLKAGAIAFYDAKHEVFAARVPAIWAAMLKATPAGGA